MDRRLITEDLHWLHKMREVNVINAMNVPLHIALRLKLMGYLSTDNQGGYAITHRGRDELVDRDREKIFN